MSSFLAGPPRIRGDPRSLTSHSRFLDSSAYVQLHPNRRIADAVSTCERSAGQVTGSIPVTPTEGGARYVRLSILRLRPDVSSCHSGGRTPPVQGTDRGPSRSVRQACPHFAHNLQ